MVVVVVVVGGGGGVVVVGDVVVAVVVVVVVERCGKRSQSCFLRYANRRPSFSLCACVSAFPA